jgi:nicotinate-nucleotide adenylyltransferase
MSSGAAERPRLGFLGGSFDPPHLGHIILARDALEQLGLAKVYLIPALQSPLRERPHAASYEDRLALCRAAAAPHEWLGVLDIEGQLPVPSYTINTARALAARFPESELVWLLGADQWARLPQWREYAELGRLLRFGVAARPGTELKPLPPPGPVAELLAAREVDISSTEVRERLYCKLPVAHLVPAGVVDYIASERLYLHHQTTA